MKKKLRAGCLALVIALLILAAYFLNAFFGNPVSAFLCRRSAQKYIETHYGHLDVQIVRTDYDFKMADYYAYVASPTSVDTHFTLYMRPNGAVRLDTYEDVTSGWNTLNRLDSAYRERTNALFDAPDFELRHDIAFGSLEVEAWSEYDYRSVPYGLKMEELLPDGEYDIDALAEKAGHIVFYMQHEDVSFETAAKGMLRLKELLDENGIPFFAMDFVLRLPREEGKPGSGGPVIDVQNFLCSDIYEEGLAERIRAEHEALNAFYARLDGLK